MCWAVCVVKIDFFLDKTNGALPLYSPFFDFTIKNEGGYNEIRFDNGGATNYGVSLRFLKDLYENGTIWVDLNNDGKVDELDMNILHNYVLNLP